MAGQPRPLQVGVDVMKTGDLLQSQAPAGRPGGETAEPTQPNQKNKQNYFLHLKKTPLRLSKPPRSSRHIA